MLSLPEKPDRETFARRRMKARGGFSFVEVVMGITVLALTAGVVLYGLNQLNYQASVNRLYTAAQTLAQNQIDLILTKGPFDPAASPAAYPTPNILGNDTSDLAGGATYTYYSDPTTPDALYTSERPVTIYRDPMNTNNIVQGTIQTKVKNTPHTVTTVIGGVSTVHNLFLRKATVTVAYTFRRRSYAVVMDTMRTPDQ